VGVPGFKYVISTVKNRKDSTDKLVKISETTDKKLTLEFLQVVFLFF
jgi:hypothetical protein